MSADLRDRVGAALSAFLADQTKHLDAMSDDLRDVTDALNDLVLTGGKRLRPAFCYWGAVGAGAPDTDGLITAVASLELLHACALIHDDVMDGSDTRRGLPSAHRRFAGRHRAGGWHGDPDAFGVAGAILLGDLALVWADRMLAGAELPPEALRRAQPVYDDMRTELMAGQYLDVLEQALGGGSVDRALRVARYKSAKYTVERPLQLGAALAGADGGIAAAYSAYGLPVGEAFQLRDDVLGVFGDPEETGKPAGDDLREGKRTALIASALEAAGPEQVVVMRRHLGDPHLDARGVADLRTVITETGALARVEALIEQRTEESLAAVRSAPITADARKALEELAVAATARTV
ncbi:MAG TPA: polyprenyl synthetase family protein [Mycobacteriales bacterium]|nr:polyprenyl synthetase family protein [Mycobacteriales bacterium]